MDAAAQVLGLGLRGPAAAGRSGRGRGCRRARAPRLPARRGRASRSARRHRAPASADRSSRLARAHLRHRPLRARHAFVREGLPRHRPRASGAASTTRPTSSRARRRGGRRARARLVRGGGRGCDPVRRRHERRRRRRAAAASGPRCRSTSARSTACSRWTRSRAPRASRPGARARRSRTSSREHGRTLRHFPQSFEYSTLGGWIATRAGGHFATLYTHIDDLVESVRAVTPRGCLGEPPTARLGRRPEPGPDADRLRGHPRGDHRGLDAGPGRAHVPRVGGRDLRLVRRPAPKPYAPCHSPASTRRTAACSTATRPP